jgi:hypothetical protein
MTKEIPSRRERRWIILSEDGQHVTLGRHSDPSTDEIAQAEAGLRGHSLAGWLAVMEGAYYEQSDPLLMMVRPLCEPKKSFSEAEEAFLTARKVNLRGFG